MKKRLAEKDKEIALLKAEIEDYQLSLMDVAENIDRLCSQLKRFSEEHDCKLEIADVSIDICPFCLHDAPYVNCMASQNRKCQFWPRLPCNDWCQRKFDPPKSLFYCAKSGCEQRVCEECALAKAVCFVCLSNEKNKKAKI